MASRGGIHTSAFAVGTLLKQYKTVLSGNLKMEAAGAGLCS